MALTKTQLLERCATIFGTNTHIKTVFKAGKATFSTEDGGDYTCVVGEKLGLADGHYDLIIDSDGDLEFTPVEPPKEESDQVSAQPYSKANSSGAVDKVLF